MKNTEENKESQIEKSYNYIAAVTIKQGRLLSKELLYGDGSIHGNNKQIFEAVYNSIKNYLQGN